MVPPFLREARSEGLRFRVGTQREPGTAITHPVGDDRKLAGPRFPMVHLYLDRLFIVSCPPADEGRDYAGRSPFHFALDIAHGFLSRLSHSTISGNQRWPAYLYRASVFGPHKNTMITATIAVIAPATAGSQ